jgi:KipI family sensor histidine kinase inhibitor
MNYECWPLGDSALLLRFATRIDLAANAEVHRAVAALAAASLPGVRAVAPSYAALVVTFDLVETQQCGGIEALQQRVDQTLGAVAGREVDPGRRIDIPTRYGGADGPDLVEVAAEVGLSVDEVIELHASSEYRVAMIGFQPGFPYLLGLPERLQLPRRASVRAHVPAGSVAIAGAQAGIYPGDSPGGWHLLGRTTMRLFDSCAACPSLLLPGDRVRFVQVR